MDSKNKVVLSPPRKRIKAFSTIDIKNKRPCFKSKENHITHENDNLYKQHLMEPDGPLVITHIQKKIKTEIEKKEIKRKQFTYFIDHRDCPETILYTHDLLHPKILRHYSKDKNKSKKNNVSSKQKINNVLSSSIRETNKFNVFMNLLRTNKIKI